MAVLGHTDGLWRAPSGMRAIQINIPRPAVPITDRDIDTINDPSRLRRDPTFARLIRPALLGLAGHLDTLAHADIPELDELWRARAMLLDPSQTRSVAKIAAAVGLPNAAHFSRIFRARYGLSPRELRGLRAARDPVPSAADGPSKQPRHRQDRVSRRAARDQSSPAPAPHP